MRKKDEEINKKCGERLRAYRDAKKIQQKELAEKAGYTPQHISNVERGLRSLTVEAAQDFAKILGCSADYLLCKTDYETAFEEEMAGYSKSPYMVLYRYMLNGLGYRYVGKLGVALDRETHEILGKETWGDDDNSKNRFADDMITSLQDTKYDMQYIVFETQDGRKIFSVRDLQRLADSISDFMGAQLEVLEKRPSVEFGFENDYQEYVRKSNKKGMGGHSFNQEYLLSLYDKVLDAQNKQYNKMGKEGLDEVEQMDDLIEE